MRRVDAPQPPSQETDAVGTPTFLLVAAAGVLAAVVGVVIVGASNTTWGVLAALVIVVAGLVAVSATITVQLGRSGDGQRTPRV